MRLRVFLPTQVLIDRPVGKVQAEAINGSFCLLPRHVDFATALVPGVLVYWAEDGQEQYLAVDDGILVKRGSEVMVSSRYAVQGEDLASLKNTVERDYKQLDEHERLARSALARLEAGVVRRFVDVEGLGR